jgi:hypothetical protein
MFCDLNVFQHLPKTAPNRSTAVSSARIAPRARVAGKEDVTSDAPIGVKQFLEMFADARFEGHAAEDGSAWTSVRVR